MSEEKLLCVITHRQIIAGGCPWCRAAIREGSVTSDPATAEAGDSPFARWNWPVLENDLRAEDAHVRHLASLNLASLSHELERALPLIALALTDADDEVRFHAEMACEQLGRDLSSDEANWLEGEIRNDRQQLVARMMLLANYFLASQPETRARRADHIFWLIVHHPHLSIAGTPDALLLKRQEPEWYDHARELWINAVAAHKSDATVLGNAARFFLLNEPDRAMVLLRDAQTLEPENTKWHELLAQLHTLSARHGAPEHRALQRRRAMIELEMAEQLRSGHAGVPSEDEEQQQRQLLNRIYTLPERARAALDAGERELARQLAEECLALASSDAIDEYFRNDGNAIHYCHTVLGHLALGERDPDRARNHLIESGKTEGSPNLGSFGPNMSLAKAILEQGDSAAVLEYLDLCHNFWTSGADELIDWKRQIAAGRIPRFGANLEY